MKLNVIEEADDLSSVKVGELIDSLQTFEISINKMSKKRSKDITLVSNTEEVGS